MTDSRLVSGIRRCLLAMAGVLAFILTMPAPPAAASNLAATNGQSSVVAIDPSGVVRAGVIGGDAAVRITAQPGHDVVVLGYQGEPYLRIAADGTASVNAHSPARALNRTRNGDSDADPTSITAEPEWITIAGTGEVIWHDHRVHSMAAVDDGHDWTISLIVDGQPVEIRGVLEVRSPPPVLLWVLIIAMLSGAVIAIGRRNPATTALLCAAIAAVISLLLAVMVTIATPVQLGRDLFPVLLTLGAWIACIGGAFLRGRSRIILTIASAALSAGFLATMLKNLSSAVPMPVFGPPVVNRVALSIALSSMLASIVLAVIASGRPPTQPPLRARPDPITL